MSEHRIYSCDDHLDINAMPRDAWSSRLPAKFRDAGLRTTEKDGQHYWLLEDNIVGISGRSPDMKTAIDRVEGLDPDGLRAGDPKRRLEDMEHDGIWASIVYGPNALSGYRIEDPELKKASIRAWNDWSAEEFNSHAPDRLSALPMLPTHTPDEAITELERVVGLGHRGAIVHQSPGAEPIFEDAWHPFWDVAQDAALPISVHLGAGAHSRRPQLGSWRFPAFVAIVPM